MLISSSMTASPMAMRGFPPGFPQRPRDALDVWRKGIMKIKSLSKICAVSLLALAAAGCSSWDSMSHRQKSTVTGAGIGGVAGAVITNGGVLGTVGGAAIGGVIGNQVGK
jgi:osmotically inducible lipoprotein OsmB